MPCGQRSFRFSVPAVVLPPTCRFKRAITCLSKPFEPNSNVPFKIVIPTLSEQESNQGLAFAT